VAVVGGILGWLLRLERRMGTALTREEHDRICTERTDRMEKKLDRVADRVDDLYDHLIASGGR
jgi:hypothetical protein